MSVQAELSDASTRHHRFGRRSALKKTAVSHSDFDEPNEKKFQDNNSHRSASVCAGGVDIPPRMAQLETLEAKMANIEVSLSMTPRRRKSSSINIRSPLSQILQAPQMHQGQSDMEGRDPSRVNQKEKENRILSLKEQISSSMNISRESTHCNEDGTCRGQPPLSDSERKFSEGKLITLRSDMEAKRTTIKGLKTALERLDITDNIDVRIQQAELEYQLGREELELLTLMEHSRELQLLIEQDDNMKIKQDQQTIFSCVDGGVMMTIHAVQVEYDPKSPQFGAGVRTRQCGLWVEWALEHTGMCKGDRLLEVNGKLVLSKSKEDMTRLLSISPNPAQLVVLRTRPLEGADTNGSRLFAQNTLSQVGSLRAELNALREQAEEAQRTKDGLRSDNLRLTHRITYLEEQVAELLDRNKDHDSEIQIVTPHKLTSTVNTQKNVTNINITSDPTPKPTPPKSEVQVFQKGPDVTAIVANIPGLEIGGKDTVEASANLPIIRPKSNASNVSSTQISIGHSPKSNCSKSSYSIELNDLPKPTQAHSVSNHVHFNHKTNKIGDRYSLQTSKSSNSIDNSNYENGYEKDLKPYSIRQSSSHQSIHKSKDYKKYDYNSETSAAIEIIKKNQRQYFDKYNKISKNNIYSKALSDDNSDIAKCYKREHKRSSSILEYFEKGINGHKKSSKRNAESEKGDATDGKNEEEEATNYKSSILVKRLSKYNDSEGFDFHPDRDYIDHRIDGKIIQNAHKSSRRLSKLHSKKSIDCDSEPQMVAEDKYRKCRMKILDYTSEPNSVQGHYKKHYQNSERPRPTPPKKPLRLSLHRAQSMQSVEGTKPSNETFYLHDPMQRQSSVSDVASKNETSFSIMNSNSTSKINGMFYGNHDDYMIKPDNSYSRSESSNQLSVKFSLDEEHKSESQESILEKRVKKRSHNGKISQNGQAFITNGRDNDRSSGYLSSRSESLSSISKLPNGKVLSHSHNGCTSDGLRLSTCNDRSKAELQMKLNRNTHEKTKINGLSNFEKNESASESSRTPSRAESCHSGFRWPSSSVFKNIRIESPIKTNGHISDGYRK